MRWLRVGAAERLLGHQAQVPVLGDPLAMARVGLVTLPRGSLVAVKPVPRITAFLSVGALAAAVLVSGCGAVPVDYLSADSATRDAVMPVLIDYTEAELEDARAVLAEAESSGADRDKVDGAVSEVERLESSVERRQRLDRAWEARLNAARE